MVEAKSTFAIPNQSFGEVTTLHKLPFNYYFSRIAGFGQASGLNLDVDGNFILHCRYYHMPLIAPIPSVSLWKLNGAGQQLVVIF